MNPKNPTIEKVSDDKDMGFKDEDYLEHGFFSWTKNPHPRRIQTWMALTPMKKLMKTSLKGQKMRQILHISMLFLPMPKLWPPEMATKLKSEHEKRYDAQDI